MVSDATQNYEAQVNILGQAYRIINGDADVAPESDGSPSKAAVDDPPNECNSDQNFDISEGHATRAEDKSPVKQHKRRHGFKLVPPKRPPPQIPSAAAIVVTSDASDVKLLPLPQPVQARLGKPAIIAGFDCETHDWRVGTERKGRIGPFGWYTNNDDMSFARIVQLGWSIAGIDDNAKIILKSSLIRPEDFQISDKANACHSITQENARQNGRPLAEVLEEFMRDISQAHSQGGRICAHQLEFDAGVIDQELHRCGMHTHRSTWQRIARDGYCTMNPQVGRWLKECAGHDVGAESKQHILGLTYTMRLLGLCPNISQQRHHNAEHDAQMTRSIYAKLLEHANVSFAESAIGKLVEESQETRNVITPLGRAEHATSKALDGGIMANVGG